ncbi:hypothetical protein CAJAP_09996 [Camponotus japonicus]
MNATDIRFKRWTPAVPRKIPDNIVSSSYTTTRVFVPSYEKERRPCIEQLLANDYQRIWWQEKQAWDKTVTARKPTKKILPRMMVKRKVPTCVTVKYPTRTERLKKGRKEDLKKRFNSKVEEEPIFTAKHDDTKLNECEETKLEEHEELHKEHEEAKSEKCEKIKSEKFAETRSEKHGETEREKYEDTKSEKSMETRLEKREKTGDRYEDAKSETYEGIKLEKSEEIKSEEREETELENNKGTEKYEEMKSENGK